MPGQWYGDVLLLLKFANHLNKDDLNCVPGSVVILRVVPTRATQLL